MSVKDDRALAALYQQALDPSVPDEFFRGFAQSLANGIIEVTGFAPSNGSPLMHMTEKGVREVEHGLKTNPVMKETMRRIRSAFPRNP